VSATAATAVASYGRVLATSDAVGRLGRCTRRHRLCEGRGDLVSPAVERLFLRRAEPLAMNQPNPVARDDRGSRRCRCGRVAGNRQRLALPSYRLPRLRVAAPRSELRRKHGRGKTPEEKRRTASCARERKEARRLQASSGTRAQATACRADFRRPRMLHRLPGVSGGPTMSRDATVYRRDSSFTAA
jgi:hypothetical protein